MKPTKLIFRNAHGAGLQILAQIPTGVKCVEYDMAPGEQMVFGGSSNPTFLIGSETWVQFAPAHWNAMQYELLQQMVDAWNEKHAQPEPDSGKDGG